MKKPLSLKQLKAESCAQVSCHDLITLCELEQYMMTYDNGSNSKTVKKGEQKKHQKATLVDIQKIGLQCVLNDRCVFLNFC